MSYRKAPAERHQQQQRVRRQAKGSRGVDFFNLLTSPALLEVTESLLPAHRERLYPPTVTLSMFLKQVLDQDGSCQQAVNGWAAQRLAEGLSPRSVRTGGYCRARQRLPLSMISTLVRHSGALLSGQSQPDWQWRGRTVKLVDGTGLSMPDTAENQASYPQPGSQAVGVGFPAARMVAVICLATGGLLSAAVGPLEGKGHSEWDLFRGLLSCFSAGDVMLADALYANYFLIARLQSLGVDVVFEQHGSRKTDFRRGERLGPRDHVVVWKKPRRCPAWMMPEDYAATPDTLAMREVAVGGRILVTTLRDAKDVHKRELGELYRQRWQVELDLRNIKATMAMDVLRCKTPSMVEKELWVHLLAYNLIRLMMAQAAAESGLHPRQLSFKHTVQLWTQWLAHCAGIGIDPREAGLFRLIAQRQVGQRPGRTEPRACKRRPKSSRWLKVPRDVARQQIRDLGYPPNN